MIVFLLSRFKVYKNMRDVIVVNLGSSLPPANEVWGKVMFLHICVILFTEGGLHPGGRYPGESASRMGSASRGESASRRGLHPGGWADPPAPIGYYGVRSTSGWYVSYWNAFLFILNLIVTQSKMLLP